MPPAPFVNVRVVPDLANLPPEHRRRRRAIVVAAASADIASSTPSASPLPPSLLPQPPVLAAVSVDDGEAASLPGTQLDQLVVQPLPSPPLSSP
ncbi:hypothetical protein HK405_005784, partial [Cladochytrium tenue]